MKLKLANARSLKVARANSLRTRLVAARAFAEGLMPMIRGYQAQGMGLRAIADEMNNRNVPTYRGNGRWTAAQLSKMQRCIGT